MNEIESNTTCGSEFILSELKQMYISFVATVFHASFVRLYVTDLSGGYFVVGGDHGSRVGSSDRHTATMLRHLRLWRSTVPSFLHGHL